MLMVRSADGGRPLRAAPLRPPAPAAFLTPASGLARESAAARSNSFINDAEPIPADVIETDVVELQLTGVNYQWRAHYSGLPRSMLSPGVGKPVAPSSSELHLPAETDVRLRLKSRDFVYLITISDSDGGSSQISQIAVPNHTFTLDFNTGREGILLLQGDHLCGLPQPALNLAVVVQPERVFRNWVDAQRK